MNDNKRIVAKFSEQYVIVNNARENDIYYCEDGYGYTDNILEAGYFTLNEVNAFSAKIVNAKNYATEKKKGICLAISISNLLEFLKK